MPCVQANRDAKRVQRDGARKLRSVQVGGDVLREAARLADMADRAPVAPAKVSAKSDLEMARDALVDAIDEVKREDPTRLGPLVRELRETWKALAVVASDSESEAVEDEFARARRIRAERQAGA